MSEVKKQIDFKNLSVIISITVGVISILTALFGVMQYIENRVIDITNKQTNMVIELYVEDLRDRLGFVEYEIENMERHGKTVPDGLYFKQKALNIQMETVKRKGGIK